MAVTQRRPHLGPRGGKQPVAESSEVSTKVVRIRKIPPPPQGEKLAYSIELWDRAKHGVERVLARAASVVLARAIFAAALVEHPNRYITLRRGSQVIADSEGSQSRS